MIWLLLALATIAACEILLRSHVMRLTGDMLAMATKARATIFSKAISDNSKERALPLYALRMAASSLRLLAVMAACALPFLIAATLAGYSLTDIAHLFTRLNVAAGITGFAVCYLAVRRRFAHASV